MDGTRKYAWWSGRVQTRPDFFARMLSFRPFLPVNCTLQPRFSEASPNIFSRRGPRMTFTCRIVVLGTLALLMVPRASQAGELAGSVNLREGIVYVEVDDEGKPAVGVKVRLQETRKKEVVAQGKINAEGKWSWPLFKAGSYEVVIEPREAGQEPQVWPLDVRGKIDPSAETDAKKCDHCPMPPTETTSEEGRIPWLPVGLGLGFIGSCGLVVWFSKFKQRF
jgi:hypothetical protein